MDVFEIFLAIRRQNPESISDSFLLKMVNIFMECFLLMAHTKDQLKMCWHELARALKVFFTDANLVELCMNDL